MCTFYAIKKAKLRSAQSIFVVDRICKGDAMCSLGLGWPFVLAKLDFIVFVSSQRCTCIHQKAQAAQRLSLSCTLALCNCALLRTSFRHFRQKKLFLLYSLSRGVAVLCLSKRLLCMHCGVPHVLQFTLILIICAH